MPFLFRGHTEHHSPTRAHQRRSDAIGLQGIYARDGLDIARSTICGWHEQLADLAEPLVEAMLRDAFTQRYLCTDATGVLVLAKEQCQRAHFWVLVAPERHVLYRFSQKHDCSPRCSNRPTSVRSCPRCSDLTEVSKVESPGREHEHCRW